MGISERRDRDRQAREQRIVAAARAIAERDGWDGVTIRRLAEEIEYSQPVLYSHFENRDAIVAAVAVQGFAELADLLRAAAEAATGRRNALKLVAGAYIDFALRGPALYDAMFTRPTSLRFATSDTRPEARAAFGAMAAVVAPFCDEAELVTETFWSALHGLAELERSGRIRADARADRIRLVVRAIAGPRKS